MSEIAENAENAEIEINKVLDYRQNSRMRIKRATSSSSMLQYEIVQVRMIHDYDILYCTIPYCI